MLLIRQLNERTTDSTRSYGWAEARGACASNWEVNVSNCSRRVNPRRLFWC